MAGQATELFNLASSFDPLSAYRQGQMTSQKFDIQQAVLDEQTKEIESEKAAELGQQAGQPVALAKMANQMIPDAKLYNDDGSLTVAGQMNDVMVNSAKLAKQSKMMGMQAALIEDPYQRVQAMSEARRLGQTAQADALKAREMNDKVKSDSIYAAAMSKDQAGWDAALQAYQDTGLPLPKGIPTTYSPDNAKKITALAPAALQSKIANDQLKQAEDARRTAREERAVVAAEAKARNGDGSGGETKITAEIDKRLNQSEVGLKTANQIETILSNPKAAKALDNSQFLRSLLETPKELGSVEKYIKSNVYQSLPKESQDLVTLIVKMRNDYYRQTSGQAVTGGEAARNFFAVVQPSDNTQTILNKIKNQKNQYSDALEAGIDDYKMPTSRKNRLKALVEEGRKGSTSEGKTSNEERPANVPKEAKIAPDGSYYAPDPSRPGKYIKY
jgi:hypothetical protein